MYYDIAIFSSQYFVAPTGCIINAMDLKTFPNTTMLLTVDQFEGFLNWSNIDELVINSTSGCNCNNYELNNNNYQVNNNFSMKAVFSYSKYFLI